MVYNCNNDKTKYTTQKEMFIANSIHYSATLYNCFKNLNLGLFLSDVYFDHLFSISLSVFQSGYRGKTIDFARNSSHHRTSIAHFLNRGQWDSQKLQHVLKQNVIRCIYQEAQRSAKPVFCIVDDTIASHAKPSSRAGHPIEAAYFHQSHLKGKQDYGHQAVSVMLSCNGICLNYAIVLYDKSKSKIRIVQEIAEELPEAPVKSYFLCDSWYSSAKVMDSFIKKGFYTIGALKTNRIIYPCGIRRKVSGFAACIDKQDAAVSLVTVERRKFYVYRYEGELNDIPNAAVVISYPKEAFSNPNALRVFISTDVSLTTQEILDIYTCRWQVELFFRESKRKLALDKYQIRTQTGAERYWLIMSLVHYICCTYDGFCHTFEDGYHYLKQKVKEEQTANLYNSIRNGMPFEKVLSLVG